VGTSVGPWPTQQIAIGWTGPSAAACAKRVPPRVRILLRAPGLAVEQQWVGRPGVAAQPAVEGDDPRLGGGGAEVEGKDGAGIRRGHGGQW
jgi:hypothetical protein